MMRSLYSGVSGLQNHQTRMDVVGNNISNVNTIGFKRGRVNFQDMISQYVGGSARPTQDLGGVNPKQVGLGMTIAAIDTIHTQGSLQSTGVVTDLAVSGDGFFILQAGNQNYYTRAGAFGVDADGGLVNPSNGMHVQGWQVQDVEGQRIINTSGEIGNITIPVGGKDPAAATTLVELASNLDKRTPLLGANPSVAETMQSTWSVDKEVYDSFGNTHRLNVKFTRIPESNNQWNVAVTVGENEDSPTNTLVDVGAANNNSNNFIVSFDNLGALSSVVDAQGDTITTGDVNIPVAFTVVGGNPDDNGAPLRQTFNLKLGQIGSYNNSVTQFAETSSTKAFRQDGYTMGYLESFRVDQSGIITGVYSNGTSRPLAQVALASFTNPGGLEKNGETNFIATNNSGDPNIGASGTAGKGRFVSGTLEMSNVDLSEEFTDMIVTQRGFQANSKTIQTADQMLLELMSLKR